MQHPLVRFLLFWALNTLVLWVSAELFASVRFDGWSALHGRFATKPLADLLSRAIDLARDGFPSSQSLGRVARGSQADLTADSGCNDVFFGAGVPRSGNTLRQPDLARTLGKDKLRIEGPAATNP